MSIKFESEEVSITGDYLLQQERFERGRYKERSGRLRCVRTKRFGKR